MNPVLQRKSPRGERPTASFRREHAEIHVHLGHVRDLLANLADASATGRRAKMEKVVGFFRGHIAPHAAAEEEALHPVVDRCAGGGGEPFTASMRHEHRIVRRWIAALAREARGRAPDARAFVRKADALLGLIEAHFECEEKVLLPILDDSMSAREFERQVGLRTHHA